MQEVQKGELARQAEQPPGGAGGGGAARGGRRLLRRTRNTQGVLSTFGIWARCAVGLVGVQLLALFEKKHTLYCRRAPALADCAYITDLGSRVPTRYILLTLSPTRPGPLPRRR